MTKQRLNPSLRHRLLISLLFPGITLAVLLGVGGAILINNVVTATYDRLLEGAIIAIKERVGVEEGEVTVDIPMAAFGMLESEAQDSIYYSVLYAGNIVTGYSDLPLDGQLQLSPGNTAYWDARYKGKSVRLAAQAQWLYGKPKPVLIVIAETTSARHALEHRMLLALALLEAALLIVLTILAWFAIDRGLRPLTNLSDDIDARGVHNHRSLEPLILHAVPREALAPAMALNALLQRLRESVGAIQRFTADASHQMLTPLAIMQTHLALARRHISTPGVVGTALTELDDAVRRLDHLVSQLIALAHADENASAMSESVCDLGQVTAGLVADRFPQALAVGIEIQVERPDGPVPIQGAEFLIRELTANLLDNAVRYSNSGGSVDVKINIGWPLTQLEIEDSGPGIPAAERVRVFERFYRVPRTDGPQGSGLGLAIVRAICDRIGANITLCDRPGGSGLLVAVTFRSRPDHDNHHI